MPREFTATTPGDLVDPVSTDQIRALIEQAFREGFTEALIAANVIGLADEDEAWSLSVARTIASGISLSKRFPK